MSTDLPQAPSPLPDRRISLSLLKRIGIAVALTSLLCVTGAWYGLTRVADDLQAWSWPWGEVAMLARVAGGVFLTLAALLFVAQWRSAYLCRGLGWPPLVALLGCGAVLLVIADRSRLTQQEMVYQGVYYHPAQKALLVNGVINDSLDEKIKDMAGALNKPVSRLLVSLDGGDVDQGLELLDWINAQGLEFVAQGRCDSICAYMWLMADRRGVAGNLSLGFHSPYLPGGQPSTQGQERIRERLAGTGLPESFFTRVFDVGSEDLCRVNPYLFRRWGFAFTEYDGEPGTPANCIFPES